MSTGPGNDTSWEWQNPLPQGNDLLAQSWTSVTTGWVVGRNGVVLKTTNSGATWTYQDPGISKTQANQVDLTGVSFTSSTNGWIVGGTALAKHTTDGGSTWTTATLSSAMSGQVAVSVAATGSNVIVAGSNGRLSYSTNGGTNWNNPASNPAANTLTAVCWATGSTAYAVGLNGTAMRTTDSGANWTILPYQPTTNPIYDVSFVTQTYGYVVASSSSDGWRVRRTISGGQNAGWTTIPSQETTSLYGVSLLDADNLVVAGAGGAIYKTANGSQTTATNITWTKMSPGQLSAPGITIRSIKFIDSTHLSAIGDNGVTAYSSDAGVSWQIRNAPTTTNILASSFPDSTHGWAVGTTGTVEYTSDGGTTWTGGNVGVGTWRGVWFPNTLSGFIVGDGGAILRTNNGGATWASQVASGTTVQLNAIAFSSSATQTGIAVGNGGLVRGTTTGGSTWTTISNTGSNMLACCMLDTTHALAVGANSTIRYYTSIGGTIWLLTATETYPTGQSGRNLNALRGISSTTAWIVGDGGLLWTSANVNSGLLATWTNNTTQTGTGRNLYSLGMLSTTSALIGGANGTLKRYSGSSFTSATASGLPANGTAAIRALSMVDASNGWYGGDGGIIGRSTDGGANWASRQRGTFSPLNAVSFPDSSHGWAVGNGGVAMVTSDSGATWSTQLLGTTNNLRGVFFADTAAGYAVGASGFISRTSNGGVTWGTQTSNTSNQLNAVASPAGDGTHAIAVGNTGTIRYTTNSGTNWAAATSIPSANSGDNMMAVTFPNTATPAVAYVGVNHTAGDGHAGCLRTTDSGSTWTTVTIGTQPVSSISFAPYPNQSIGWACAGAGVIYGTTDGGLNWIAQTTPITTALSGISAATSQTVFAVGQNGVVVQTSDGGTRWMTQNDGFGSSGAAQSLNAVKLTDASHGFVVGSGGTILRTTSQTPPTTTLSVSPSTPDGLAGWYRVAAPTITLSSNQTGQTYYCWDAAGGPFSTYGSAVTAPEGAHTLYYYSANVANRLEPIKSAVYRTDRTAPPAPTLPAATTVNTNTVQVNWTPSLDTASGVSAYRLWYRIGAGASTLATTTSSLVSSALVSGLNPNTTYTFYLVADDAAGNTSANSLTTSAKTNALSALTTTLTVAPSSPNGLNSWYTSTPTVSFSVSPNEAANIHYGWSVSSMSLYGGTAMPMTDVGTQTLLFWSVDQAGFRAQEDTRSQTLKLDTTSPSRPTVSAVGVSTSSLQVNWSGAVDAQSGIDHYELWVGGTDYGAYSGTSTTVNGLAINHSYQVYVVTYNRAGLASTSDPVDGKTQSNAAVSTTYTVTPALPDGLNGWYVAPPSITLASLPTTVPAWTHYEWDGSEMTTYTGSTVLALSADGVHSLYYYSVDQDDPSNKETTRTLTLRLDVTAPGPPTSVVPQSLDTTSVSLGWSVGSDLASGVDHYLIYVDGGLYGSATGTTARVTGLLPNSLHSFAIAAVDAAGNTSGESSPVWGATSSLPALTTTATSTPAPNGANGWYTTAPTITFSVSPAISAYTYSAWDGSAMATVTGSVAMSLAGTHTLSFWSVDQASQRAQEVTQTQAFKFDPTPPSAPAATAVGASSSSLSVSWTAASDPESGVDHYEIYVDGWKYGGSFTGTSASVEGLGPNQPYSVRVDAVNGAGASVSSDAVDATTFSNDAVFTESAVSPVSANGANGWYVTTPVVTLISRPTTVPAWTIAGWDGAGLTTYTASVAVPSDGSHTLSYLSVDRADAGNRETTRTLTLRTDTGLPSPPTTVIPMALSTTSIGVDWTFGADSLSGVDHYVLYVDNMPQPNVTSTGTVVSGLVPNSLHSFAVATVDQAGNVSAQSPTVWSATAANPALSTAAVASPAVPNGLNGWYVTNPTITLSSLPATAPADILYGWGGSAMATYTAPISPSSDGTRSLAFRSVDRSGQSTNETTQNATYKIDTSVPSVPGNVLATGDSTRSLLVTWDPATDAQSGLDHYELWVDGTLRGSYASVATSAAVTGLGVNRTYVVHVVAFNVAGLSRASADVNGTTQSNTAISTLRSSIPATPNGANGWYVTTPTVTLTSQPSALAAWTYFSWDGSALSTYTAAISVPAQGLHQLDYHSVDQADPMNRDATASAIFRLDTQAPASPTGVTPITLDTTSVAVSWTAGSDTNSGIDHYVLYVNGAPWGSVSATGTTVAGLTPNTLYTFSVVTVDVAGNVSNQSPGAFATTTALAPLTTTVAATPVVPNGLNGWYTTTPTVTFSVAPAAVPAWTRYSWDGSAPSTATGPILAPQGTHTLSYWSVDQAGQHAVEASHVMTFSVDSAGSVAATSVALPPSIIATMPTVTDTQVYLQWLPAPIPASGFNHYEIWDDYIGSTVATSYVVSGLEPETTYGFKVYAVSDAGTFYSSSDTMTVETSPTPIPDTPSSVAAVAPSGGYVNVDWQPVASHIGPAGYHIWRSADAINYSQIATVTGQYTNAYVDSTVRSSTRYWYAVSAFDDRGEGVMTDTSTPTWPVIAPITGRPQRVKDMKAIEGSNTVSLNWSMDSNAAVTGYLVTRASKSLGGETTLTPVQIVATSTPSFVDTSALNGQVYYYRAYPVDTSMTVGYGSLEIKARPRSVDTTPDPHVHKSNETTTSQCYRCHTSHSGTLHMDTPGGLTGNAVCLKCHAAKSGLASIDTSSELSDPLNLTRIPISTPTSSTEAMLKCTACHRVLTSETSPTAGLLGVGGLGMSGEDGVSRGDAVCYCHGKDGKLKGGDLRGFETAAHFKVPDPPSGSQVKCIACHEHHASRNTAMASYEGYMLCVQCHSGGASVEPTQTDIWSGLQLNSDADSGHALLPQDQATGARIMCQNCHSTHFTTKANPVVDPHDPSPSGKWTGNTRTFCLRCHDGQALPTSAETSGYASAVRGQSATTTAIDLRAAYNVNVHGVAAASDPATTSAYLRPDMGYAAGDTLECTACHDSHGSTNNFTLRTSVPTKSGEATVTGVLVYKIPAGSITPTSPVGYDTRFFCSTCHLFDPVTHDPMAGTDTTKFGTVDCMSCHSHLKSGSPSTGL